MPSKATGACDERQLEVLLDGEEGSDEFVAAAGHVERCTACQARLVDLAGDESSWLELRNGTGARLRSHHQYAGQTGRRDP